MQLDQRFAALRLVNGSIFEPDDFTEHKSLTQIHVFPFSKICTAFAQLIETKETDGVLSGDHEGISPTVDGDSYRV